MSTDAIVGFPNETEDDFRQTLSIFEEVGYASGFVFRYSPRPGTASFEWQDDVPGEVKTERLIRLNEALTNSRSSIHASLIGKTLEILIEGTARKHPDQATGRSREGYVVAVPNSDLNEGDIICVEVEGISGFTLLARQLETTKIAI